MGAPTGCRLAGTWPTGTYISTGCVPGTAAGTAAPGVNAAAGSVPAWVWLASIPYAITVTTVLIGKHVDKYEQDRERGIHTLPVLLGKTASLRLNQALMVAFYPIVLALVLGGWLGVGGVGLLLVAGAIPRLVQVLKAYSQPKPAAPPAGYRLWPLWYVSLAFYHNKLAGGLFVVGLALDAVIGL